MFVKFSTAPPNRHSALPQQMLVDEEYSCTAGCKIWRQRFFGHVILYVGARLNMKTLIPKLTVISTTAWFDEDLLRAF
jgi:hypothetical protein